MSHDLLCALAAAAALAGSGAAWAWRSWLGLLLLVIGLGLSGLVLIRLYRAERLAMELANRPGARLSLSQSLRLLADGVGQSDRRLAQRHSVTGLPTREHLFACIDDAGRDAPVAQLLGLIRFSDLDRMAAFDQAGAASALAALADRLRSATAPSHILAQIDRDCFAVWFQGTDVASAAAQFRAIVYVAHQELIHGDEVLTPALEVASAQYPDDGLDGAQLLVRATASLNRLEVSASGEVRFPNPPTIHAAREEFILEQDLARAIREDQLTVVFQPVVDVVAGRIAGAEALLRWEHPILGPISPARFMPVVESIGLSDKYGLWVLNCACREARRWQDSGLDGLKVAVNLSARQLQDPDLQVKIMRTLQRHDLAAERLELELTETATMADAGRTLALFTSLRSEGISLAIDDFGSGYSSLSYLKNLPFDKLKIDREFVAAVTDRPDSAAICKALIELGRGLNLRVLAEGVEDLRDVQTLVGFGCTLFQGYYFSRPVSDDRFLELACDPSLLPPLRAASSSETLQSLASI